MKEYEIGPLTISIIELSSTSEALKKYDVIASRDGQVIRQHIGCIGEKSRDYWETSIVKFANRYRILDKVYNMDTYNLWCYSSDISMTIPKEGYENEFEECSKEIKILEEWIEDLTGVDRSHIDSDMADMV